MAHGYPKRGQRAAKNKTSHNPGNSSAMGMEYGAGGGLGRLQKAGMLGDSGMKKKNNKRMKSKPGY